MSTQGIPCFGAVYGKADNQSTGYRWLEVSEEKFKGASDAMASDRLVKSLSLGQERLEGDQYFSLRMFDGRCYALRSYGSRAQDRSGRSGIVERMIVELGTAGPPSPQMALGMFNRLQPEQFGSRWWEQRGLQDWEDPRFHLKGLEFPVLPASEEELDEVCREAREKWLSRIDRAGLEKMLCCLLSDERPAVFELPADTGIPSFKLIIALLAGLGQKVPSGLSIAGWFPCAPTEASTLKGWDIVIAEAGRIKRDVGFEVSPDVESIAKTAADSLLGIHKKIVPALEVKHVGKPLERPEPGRTDVLEAIEEYSNPLAQRFPQTDKITYIKEARPLQSREMAAIRLGIARLGGEVKRLRAKVAAQRGNSGISQESKGEMETWRIRADRLEYKAKNLERLLEPLPDPDKNRNQSTQRQADQPLNSFGTSRRCDPLDR